MFILLSLASAFAHQSPIVNGSITSDYMSVGMFAQCWGNQGCADFCSGTLIQYKWYLTAAHCVEGLSSNDELYVIFGRDWDNTFDYDEVKRFIIHPDYNGMNSDDLSNDIALVELKNGLGSIDPMPLNRDSMNNSWLNDELQMVGFGLTSSNSESTGVKRTADMYIYNFDYYFVYMQDENEQQNICSGDSGGAALGALGGGNYELVGVNSFTSGECESWYSGVVRVDSYVSWMEQYVDFSDVYVPPEEPDAEEPSTTEPAQPSTEPSAPEPSSGEPSTTDESWLPPINSAAYSEQPEGTKPSSCSTTSLKSIGGWGFIMLGFLGLRGRRTL